MVGERPPCKKCSRPASLGEHCRIHDPVERAQRRAIARMRADGRAGVRLAIVGEGEVASVGGGYVLVRVDRWASPLAVGERVRLLRLGSAAEGGSR